MKTTTVKFLQRNRGVRKWCAMGILTIALVLELTDAAFGLQGLAAGRDLAAANVVDIADVVAGLGAAWFFKN